MKTPLQELYEFMEQNQYFIGNDLYAKYHELIKKEKEVIQDAFIEGYQKSLVYPDQEAVIYYNKKFNGKE